MKPILVIAEIFESHIRSVTLELAAAAREIENKQGRKQIPPAIFIIVPAGDPLPLAKKISAQTGMNTIGLKIPGNKAYTSEVYIHCLGKLINKMDPSHILIAHTSQGRDFAPGLAMDLNAASIPSVTGIRYDKDGLVYLRPVLDNTQNMVIRPALDRSVVLTLMPGVFIPDSRTFGKPGQVDIHTIPFEPGPGDKIRIQHHKVLKKSCENQALKGAKVIVAAGRGLGEKQNLESIFKFAECFSSSAIGASRPLVDMGWIGHEHQVGITGNVVAPELYIACGISGSSQHLAGMKDAKFVISINKNPDAPIFRHSDLCITENVLEFIHTFLKQKRKFQWTL